MFEDSQFDNFQNILKFLPGDEKPGNWQKVPCGKKCTYSRASGNISQITRLLKAEKKAKANNHRISDYFHPINVPGQVKQQKKRLIQTSICKYMKDQPPKNILGKRPMPINVLAGYRGSKKFKKDIDLSRSLKKRYQFATMKEAELKLDELEQMDPLACFYIEPIEDSQPQKIIPDLDTVLMDDTLQEIAGHKQISPRVYTAKSKKFLKDNHANLDLIRNVLVFMKQTDKMRGFQGLQFVELFLPGQCYCNRCAVMRNPIARNPFWWVTTMGCHYTAMLFKMFDIKNFYSPIFNQEYKQQYLLQLKDHVVIRMLDSLEIKYFHRKYCIIKSPWGSMDVDFTKRTTLNIKELKHQQRMLKCLASAYQRARSEALGRCFKALQPLNFQQYMILNNLQFVHEGQIYKLVFLSVHRKAQPGHLAYDRVKMQEADERKLKNCALY